jgi:GlpG protein
MRLIHSFDESKKAQVLSLFLSLEKIENKIEIDKTQTDAYQIWIVVEEDLQKAQEHLNEYLENPNAEKFQKIQETANTVNKAFKEIFHKQNKARKNQNFSFKKPLPKNFLTHFFIGLCISITIILNLSAEAGSQLYPLCLFDYNLSSSSFPGFYSYLVYALKSDHAPLSLWLNHFEPFYNIKLGEFWRLFTPAILHTDAIHLIFNMIWLWTLGPQIEARLSFPRYLSFIFITAIFSNLCQYLISGPYFLGFSGVVMAMLGFIWVRQKISAWEGYMVHSSTFMFIGIYIFGLLALEIISFLYFLVKGETLFGLNMANTAHIAGGLIGALLGKTSFFKMKS